MAELKVSGCLRTLLIQCRSHLMVLQNKLEAQYAAKRDAHLSEAQDLKQQLDARSNEIRSLNATIDSLKSVNEELKVSLKLYLSISQADAENTHLLSVHLLRLPRASKEARTWPSPLRTWSGRARQLAFNWPNLMASRSLLCVICRTVARR